MSKIKKRVIRTIPSNKDVEEIQNHQHLSEKVKDGILALHKYDMGVKDLVLTELTNAANTIPGLASPDAKVEVIEILCPHLVDSTDYAGNYVQDCVNDFISRFTANISDKTSNAKEAIMIQFRFRVPGDKFVYVRSVTTYKANGMSFTCQQVI